MKRMIITVAAAIIAAVAAHAQTSSIVSGSTSFAIGSIAGTIQGTFDAPKGKFIFDPANLGASQIDITIAAASVSTDHTRRDSDAKGEKYLNVGRYPTIRFTATKVEAKGHGYVATGTLRIKETTKTVALPFEAKRIGDGSYSLSSTFEINRLDYSIGGKTFMLRNVATVSMDALAN